MEKTKGKRNLFTKWFTAFLAISIVFLAVGLGTLGSGGTVGKAFELKTQRGDDDFNVVVRIDRDVTETYTDTDGTEKTRSYSLEVKHIYLNVAAVYAEAGTPGVLRMRYGSGSSSFSSTRSLEAEIENFYTAEQPAADPEKADEQKRIVCEDALFRWIAPFDGVLNEDWDYSYLQFTALEGRDLLLNEIVIVGEKIVDSKGTGEYMVVPATVYSATPNSDEPPEAAKERAQATLFDAQRIPAVGQSSYYRYTQDELYTLSTLAEMRRGEYDEALASSAYHVEGVYGPLGTDLVALGTKIFGTNPFGIRFFPMLASFGVLVIGYFLVKQLTKSEKAGVVFAALYALSNLSFSLAQAGPLMIGVFFFVAALYLCHRFYAHGMKRLGTGALTLAGSGLCGAAAICSNGAFLLPVAGIAALFAFGIVRQMKARRYHLDNAIALAEAPGAGEEAKQNVARVMQEYRTKNIAACVSFGLTLVVGSILFALLFTIPLYTPYLRLYTAAASANIFTLAAHAFAGGFVGSNPGAGRSAWDLFAVLFEGTGTRYAVTAAVINAVAAAAAIFGIVFAVYRIVRIVMQKNLGKAERGELRTTVVPLAGLVLSLILTAFGGGAPGFLLLGYVFAFALAAHAVATLTEGEGKAVLTAKICTFVGLGLLIAVFALCAIFTFSIPVPATFLAKIL